ncbi:MAG: hypothetical protein IPJ59_10480 [Nannocystis sp.]|nr:hypothetical protein [Nannocystis sp.]
MSDVLARMRRDRQNGRILDYRRFRKPPNGGPGPAKEAFDCLFLCDHCGYLSDVEGACPSCTHTAWIDLDNWAHAERLREVEEGARQNPVPEVRWRVRGASLAVGAVLGLGCVTGLALAGMVAVEVGSLVGVGAGAMGAGTVLTHALGRRRFGWSLMAKGVRNPSRWRVPLPIADPKAGTLRRAAGPALASGPLLQAPFTGRACVAYEVAVLFDHPSDAWPPTWVLREMRSCAFEVDGREVGADRATLGAAVEAVERPVMNEDQKRRFLRERGLFLADGSFDLYEAIVAPDAYCEVLWPLAPEGAPPFVVAATGPVGRHPYRG